MRKRNDTQGLNIPTDDIECWDRYPKFRWMYDLSRLLDAQGIRWSPYETDMFKDEAYNMDLISADGITCNAGTIYINRPSVSPILAEVYISKGEIKLLRYIDKATKEEVLEFVGNMELRINAFVTIHFQKFSGIVTMELINNNIMSIRLRPFSDIDADSDLMRIAKRIYKKNDFSLSSFTSDSNLVTI